MLQFLNTARNSNRVSDPILKAIVRYRNNPSRLTMGQVCNKSQKLSFLFSQIGKKDILQEMQELDIEKVAQKLELLKKTQTYLENFYYVVLMIQ